MAKSKPLTVKFFVGGKQVDKLSPEHCDRMVKAVEQAMSLYYTAHPEEFAALSTDPDGV